MKIQGKVAGPDLHAIYAKRQSCEKALASAGAFFFFPKRCRRSPVILSRLSDFLLREVGNGCPYW